MRILGLQNFVFSNDKIQALDVGARDSRILGHPWNIQDCDIRALTNMFIETLLDFGLVLHNLSVIYILATNDEIEQFWSLGRPYANSGVAITHILELLTTI